MHGCSALPGTSLLTYEINHFGTGWLLQQGTCVPNRLRAAQQPEGRSIIPWDNGMLDKPLVAASLSTLL